MIAHKKRLPKSRATGWIPSPTPTATIQSAGDSISQFDLSDDKWINDPKDFWKEFQHTGQILVPKDLEKWLIGQERMKEQFFLALETWVRKLKDIQAMRDEGRKSDKDAMRKFLKERPGPYLLYIGEPGTGKSLLIKIANAQLKRLYKKYDIRLQDVMLVKNPINDKKPLVRYVPQGMGKRIREVAEYAARAENFKNKILLSLLGFVMLIGVLLIATAIFIMGYIGMTQDPALAWFGGSGLWTQWILVGAMLLFFPMFIRFFLSGGMSGSTTAPRQSVLDKVPSLIVDNSGDPDLYVDITQNNAGSMFGSIQHDPWQSGGLGTPTHHRMQAGKIHEADGKIMFADEIKNFLKAESIVIEMLTVLEDGSYPIRARSWAGSEGNASLAGETKDPIDASFFLIAAGNYDALPALNVFPALRDRFYYGVIARAEDEIEASEENKIRFTQFIADECFRFRLPPVCKNGIELIWSHARRRASAADKAKIMMRQYIQDLKMGGQFVWAGKPVEPCGCGLDGEYIHSPHLALAVDDYAKPIEMQILDDQIDKSRVYKIISTKGAEVGKVNGLVVMGGAGTGTGDVITVTAWMKKVKEHEKAEFVVTGVPSDADTWMQNSIRTVRTTIYRLYGLDIGKDYYCHVSFLQSDPKALDGPSAGITMTLALMSWLGDPRDKDHVPVALRQDTAITGTVENVSVNGNDDIKVGPIGGVFEKVYGASRWGAKRVIIPFENFNHNWFESPLFAKVKVRGAKSVLEYFDMMRYGKE